MKRLTRALAFVLSVIALHTHVGAADGAQPSSTGSAAPRGSINGVFAKVPEKARLRPNPLANDPDSVAAGRKLFVQHCAQCHGERAEGRAKAPSLHIAEVQNATPGAIFWVMTNGVVRHGMPVWSKLPEPQRWQIAAYIKSLRPTVNTGQVHAESVSTKP